MVTEDYVSLEVAKLLKEKGFDVPCYRWYDAKSDVCAKFINPDIPLDYSSREYYLCPSQSMAMKWLREAHNISVRPRYDEVEGEKEHIYYAWFFGILSMNPYKTLVEAEQGYPTYEEAAEAGIKYCLENLI